MAMKRPHHLPEGSKVVISDDGSGEVLISFEGDGPEGHILISDGRVGSVNAEEGWGPLLYEVAMEYMTSQGKTLTGFSKFCSF